MKMRLALLATATIFGTVLAAQDFEIEVPNDWTATASGIKKGNSELAIGPVVDLGGQTQAAYLETLAALPYENGEIASIGDLKDGNVVVQILRNIVVDGEKARSIYFLCKEGRNANRLLELYTDDVFAVISGGKAAISFCDQN